MKNKEVIYISTGVNSGYYHYATCLLQALSKQKNVNIRAYFTSKDLDVNIRPPQKIHLIGNARLPCKVCRALANWFYVIKLCALLPWKKVDVIHVNTIYQPQTTLLLFVVARLSKIKTVLTVHEKSPIRLYYVGHLDQFLRKKCRELADVVVVHSTQIMVDLQNNESIRKIQVIDHGNYGIFKKNIWAKNRRM